MRKTLTISLGILLLVVIGLLVAACKPSTDTGNRPFSMRSSSAGKAPSGTATDLLPEGTTPSKISNAPAQASKPAEPGKPVTPAAATEPPTVTKHATIQTAKGDIEVELYGKDAPITVDNFVELAGKHFYKNLTFHRVETKPDFKLIQGGDPKGDGTGGSGKNIKLETSPKLRHVKGAIAMARSSDPNSASCQFYICLVDIPQLDDQYAVFGKVTKGLENAEKIEKGDKIKDITVR